LGYVAFVIVSTYKTRHKKWCLKRTATVYFHFSLPAVDCRLVEVFKCILLSNWTG
jgi:hypothetical protein